MKLKFYYHRIACKLIGFTKTDATFQKIIWYLCGVLVFETCYLISLSIVPYSNFKFLFFAVLGLVVGGKAKEKIETPISNVQDTKISTDTIKNDTLKPKKALLESNPELAKTILGDNFTDILKSRTAFNKWNKSGGKTLPGLIKRRKDEADYYFGKTCK